MGEMDWYEHGRSDGFHGRPRVDDDWEDSETPNYLAYLLGYQHGSKERRSRPRHAR